MPKDYVKFELPPESPTVVYIGIDIKDIPKARSKEIPKLHYYALSPTVSSIDVKAKKMLKQKVSDKDFTVTLNAYFIVKWHDSRVVVTDNMNRSML